jgi:CubicO group peptidase (beta-lactamase class C family)
VAINYLPDGNPGGSPLERAWSPDGPYWNLRGNGGILANPAAFLEWINALRSGGILSDDSLRLMFSEFVELGANGDHYGYGWRIGRSDNGPSFNHGGSNGETFYSHARYVPGSDSTLVFSMTNFDAETIRTILNAFLVAAGNRSE